MLDKYGGYYLDITCRGANVIILSVNLQRPHSPVSAAVKCYHFHLMYKEK